jgi:hypothetical protein
MSSSPSRVGRVPCAGRTLTTSDPVIGLQVEGIEPGEEISLDSGGGTLALEAWAQSVRPFHELQSSATER